MFKLFFFFLKLKNTESKATKNSTLIVKLSKETRTFVLPASLKHRKRQLLFMFQTHAQFCSNQIPPFFSSHKEGNKSILCNILDNKANIFTIIFSFREVFVFYKKEFLLSLGSRTCIWTGLYFVLIGG